MAFKTPSSRIIRVFAPLFEKTAAFLRLLTGIPGFAEVSSLWFAGDQPFSSEKDLVLRFRALQRFERGQPFIQTGGQ